MDSKVSSSSAMIPAGKATRKKRVEGARRQQAGSRDIGGESVRAGRPGRGAAPAVPRGAAAGLPPSLASRAVRRSCQPSPWLAAGHGGARLAGAVCVWRGCGGHPRWRRAFHWRGARQAAGRAREARRGGTRSPLLFLLRCGALSFLRSVEKTWASKERSATKQGGTPCLGDTACCGTFSKKTRGRGRRQTKRLYGDAKGDDRRPPKSYG